MAKLLAYHTLPPISEHFLGLAKDAEDDRIICTYGRNLILIIEVIIIFFLLHKTIFNPNVKLPIKFVKPIAHNPKTNTKLVSRRETFKTSRVRFRN